MLHNTIAMTLLMNDYRIQSLDFKSTSHISDSVLVQ